MLTTIIEVSSVIESLQETIFNLSLTIIMYVLFRLTKLAESILEKQLSNLMYGTD